MLFSRKENIFMCLVPFQKMFRKIFFDVWLCSWKHIFYLLLNFLTFSRLPNEYIISFIPQNTNKTQKKNHQIRTNEGEIAIDAVGAIAIAINAFAVPVMSAVGIVPVMSQSLLSFSLSLSLSLLFSKAASHLKWKLKRKWFFVVLALKFGQLEMFFSLTEFEVTTKHPIFQKIIFEINLKSIQTQPKFHNNRICFSTLIKSISTLIKFALYTSCLLYIRICLLHS